MCKKCAKIHDKIAQFRALGVILSTQQQKEAATQKAKDLEILKLALHKTLPFEAR
jgi:hypothetical protein